MGWKPGDKAVFCYRPDVPKGLHWDELALSYVGRIGTIRSVPFIDRAGDERVAFEDIQPITAVLAPLIPDKVREKHDQMVV